LIPGTARTRRTWPQVGSGSKKDSAHMPVSSSIPTTIRGRRTPMKNSIRPGDWGRE
jgi:hypothetical protein